MRARSIRFRLTVWYAVVLTAALALFGTLTWISLRHRLIADVDRDLDGRAGRFERYFSAEAAEASGAQLKDELGEFCQALPPSSYIDLRGREFSFRYPPAAAPANLNFRTVRKRFTVMDENFELEVGEPVGDLLHALDLLRLLLFSLIPVVIAIAAVGGAWMSRRALKPVDDIAAAARAISIENLSGRLPVPATGDEIARLTEVLNTMLERLEAAVKTLSQFVADASHELRTPLTVIRTTAELALRRTREPESYRTSIQEIAAETERMTRLVEDLLVLARSDTGTVEMPLTAVDLREVLTDVCAEMGGLAELRRIRVAASLGEEAMTVAGNGAALHRLFVVLLDNAVKYSRDGGDVFLKLEKIDATVAVSIEDFGAGIGAADLPHIFKRFYRADRARTDGGHGLGLSLAESIARAHGAEIDVHSREGEWSLFRVRFAARVAKAGTASAGVISRV